MDTLGGNAAGLVPEILKYPVERVVHVDLDPAVSEIVLTTWPAAARQLAEDSRCELVHLDPVRFLHGCTDRFDLVLLCTPDPVTMADSRFYTTEFFERVVRVMTRQGILVTTLSSSARMQAEAVLPADFSGTLRGYQTRGVDWLALLRKLELGALLADDMGLGKTIQALCAIEGPALVVCPTSV